MLAARAPLTVELDVYLTEPLPKPLETAMYYTVSEALANVVKHAHADSAKVRVECFERRGGGRDRRQRRGGRRRRSRLRAAGLRDRVEALDGDLWVESAPGQGTLVRAELPVWSGRLATVGGNT